MPVLILLYRGILLSVESAFDSALQIKEICRRTSSSIEIMVCMIGFSLSPFRANSIFTSSLNVGLFFLLRKSQYNKSEDSTWWAGFNVKECNYDVARALYSARVIPKCESYCVAKGYLRYEGHYMAEGCLLSNTRAGVLRFYPCTETQGL